MKSIRRDGRRPVALIVLAGLMIVGCGDPSTPVDPFKRVAVSGTVTLDGAPLPAGTIEIDPMEGAEGPTAIGEISQGKFAIERSRGPVAGKHRVIISGRPPVKIGENEQPGGTPKVVPDPVPARYNSESKLEVAVPADGSSTLEFALTKS
jgi:hypothetical protein